MTLHYKVAGTWEQVDRPYRKIAGIWTPVNEVWVKDSGEWEQAYEYDLTPPDIPLVSLEIVETVYWDSGDRKTGRHLKVGVRSPGALHDPDLKRIRVLTTYNDKAPTTQYGGTYTQGAEDSYPDEPWSDWSYNGHNDSSLTKDSSVYRYKTWPRNAGDAAALQVRPYHFTAWAEDLNGNWSVANAAVINVPRKDADGTDVIVREGRFQPNNAGSVVDAGFVSGVLRQQANPLSRGVYFYGAQLTDGIGSQGTVTIKSAQLHVCRRDDAGAQDANVYLWWHTYATQSALPSPNAIVRNDTTLLGTVTKGGSKWFDLPAAFKTQLAARNIKGFGLNHKDPAKATALANDFTVLKSLEEAPRNGELHVVWTEKP